jgi:hypothetical protein
LIVVVLSTFPDTSVTTVPRFTTPLVPLEAPFMVIPVIVPAFFVKPQPATVDSVTSDGIVGLFLM